MFFFILCIFMLPVALFIAHVTPNCGVSWQGFLLNFIISTILILLFVWWLNANAAGHPMPRPVGYTNEETSP